MKIKYRTSLDFYSKIVTTFVVVFGIFLIANLFLQNDFSTISILGILLLAGVAFFFYQKMPRYFTIKNENLIIGRAFSKVVIPKSEIESVELVSSMPITMTSGSFGVFGYLGNSMENTVQWVTNRKEIFKVKTSNKTYLLSARNREGLVSDISV